MSPRLLILSLTILWLPIIPLMGAQWTLYEQYHYGWAVPFLCVYLARRRWRVDAANWGRDASNPPRHQPGCAPMIPGLQAKGGDLAMAAILGLGLLPTRVLQEASPLWRAASYLLAAEAILLTWLLMRAGRPARPPPLGAILFFLVAVPWPTPVEGWIVRSLAGLNTAAVLAVLGLAGVPAVRQGYAIEVSHGLVGIDDACSGIRSLQATLMLALFMGEFDRLQPRRRVLLLLAGIGLAGLLNIARTLILVLVADRSGLEAMRQWHDATGLAILLGCFSGLWVLGVMLRRGAPGPPNFPAASTFEADPPSVETWPSPSTAAGGASRRARAVAGVTIASTIVSVAGTELWFRLHEAVGPSGTVEWSVTPPTHARPIPISPEVRRQLQYDTGLAATWMSNDRNSPGPTVRPDDPDSARWQLFYFRWNPARRLQDRARIQLARSHRPEICLPACGHRLRAELAPIHVEAHGVTLPFRVYEFASAEQPLFLFYGVVEDGAAPGQTANMRADHWARLDAAWRGSRGSGQRVLEIALWGARDAPDALALFRIELPRLITTTPQ